MPDVTAADLAGPSADGAADGVPAQSTYSIDSDEVGRLISQRPLQHDHPTAASDVQRPRPICRCRLSAGRLAADAAATATAAEAVVQREREAAARRASAAARRSS